MKMWQIETLDLMDDFNELLFTQELSKQ